MREIKFRAWDVVKNVMVYNGCFQFEQFPKLPLGPHDVRQRVFEFDGIESGEMVTGDVLNGWHLMQYTGLKDKNGVDIYEGDILSSEGTYKGEVRWFNEHMQAMFVVYWDDNDVCSIIQDAAHIDISVIGNIYQNPELVKL